MQVRSAHRVDSVLEIFELSRTETTLLQFAYFVAYLLVAPPMGIFMRRYGYKIGIHVGLALFSIGMVTSYYCRFVADTVYLMTIRRGCTFLARSSVSVTRASLSRLRSDCFAILSYREYGMFIAFTFVIASGLATLEVVRP